MKKQCGLCDVTMGTYGGAEVCELVGTYILFPLSEKYNKKDFRFYRDDWLGVVKNKSGPETEKIFKENKLDIVIQYNMKIVNYLDVSLNLNNSNYKPYHKLDNKILYIHKDLNQQPSIFKEFPISIEKRIFTLSSNETILNQSKEIQQKALEKSGYRQILRYHLANENVNNNKRNRKRIVIWSNPPFSVDVKTKVGNYFLNLTRKHFPLRHKFSKLFNRNTIKVSYSCMPNTKAEIHKHDKNTLEKAQQKHADNQLCNCTNKKHCPLNGQCLAESIVFLANITANIPGYKEKVYLGVSETIFKVRYEHQEKSLIKRHKNDTELSKEYWKVKQQNRIPIKSRKY